MAYGPYGGVELWDPSKTDRDGNPKAPPWVTSGYKKTPTTLTPFSSNTPTATPRDARYELETLAASKGWTPTGQPTTTTTTGGGSYSYGGGGGGSSKLTQAQVDAMRKAWMGGKPQAYTFNPFKYTPQKRPDFYKFDNSRFKKMWGGVQDAAQADLAAGNAAYDEAAAQYANIPMAFQSMPTTTDPGMSESMRRMYEANNVPTSINDRTMQEGIQADDAFGSLYSILGANEQQMANSRDLALGGDRRRLGEDISAFTRNAKLNIDMARAKALENHKINSWMYDVETADRLFDQEMAVAMGNWQGQQQVNQANTSAQNDWSGGWADILIGLIPELAAGVNAPGL